MADTGCYSGDDSEGLDPETDVGEILEIGAADDGEVAGVLASEAAGLETGTCEALDTWVSAHGVALVLLVAALVPFHLALALMKVVELTL